MFLILYSGDSIEQTLKLNTKLIAEAIVKHMFLPRNDVAVFDNSLEIGGKVSKSYCLVAFFFFSFIG